MVYINTCHIYFEQNTNFIYTEHILSQLTGVYMRVGFVLYGCENFCTSTVYESEYSVLLSPYSWLYPW